MAEETDTAGAIPSLEDWQHWTWVMGRAQQMLMETWADGMKQGQPWPAAAPPWGAFPPAFGAAAPLTAVVRGHADRRVLLAIGPEGGFIPYEIDLLMRCGFEAVHVGERILRVDTAIPFIISRLF